MKIVITIPPQVFDIGPDSFWCTEKEWRDMKNDRETVSEIFGESIHEAVAMFLDWKIEEIP